MMNMEDNKNEKRRDFLKWMLGGSIVAFFGSIIYPVFSYLKPPKSANVKISSVKLGKIDDFPKESGTIFKFGNKPGILIRNKEGDVRAFGATCTHLDCTVQYRHDLGVIWCACHNGQFDLNGRNISGPPPKPLEAFNVIIQNDEILVNRSS